MDQPSSSGKDFKDHIYAAIQKESEKCKVCYTWLVDHMPPGFFEEVLEEDILLIAHSLMGFDLQDYFSHINLKDRSIALCLDGNDADLRILEQYQLRGIKNYRTFISNAPPPFPNLKTNLRIAILFFTTAPEKQEAARELLPPDKQEEIKELLKARNLEVTDQEFQKLIRGLNMRFLRGMPKERLITALDMFFRAKTRDNCQYEVRFNQDWKDKKETPSIQIVFAWKNVPKHRFLYKLAKLIHRHGLSMRRVNATYIEPYSKDATLIMSIGLHGSLGKAAWEEAELADFLKEFATLKYFGGQEAIETTFVDSGWMRGNLGNLLKTFVHMIHQSLVHFDLNIYSLQNIEEGICRHPELTVKMMRAFEQKFHPEQHNLAEFEKTKQEFLTLVDELDTGNELNDTRRKNILKQGMFFIAATSKTNFYRNNKTAFSFRIDPAYLDTLPFDRKDKFPELPFALFFMKGMYYIGFHIRFKDLSRGGLRTVFPQRLEQMLWERNNVFSECYNLAYTQQKKNKDIPEGGAKGVIFLEPYERLQSEEKIYRKELEDAGYEEEEIKNHLQKFNQEQKLEYLYQTQRSYIECFITLLNCEPDGTLRAKHIVDYYKKPEYIYLGPDENMHNVMIEWIADYSKYYNYKPGGAFITSKPSAGINHKEFGVTSFGVNVYMEETLKFLGINPHLQPFTIKISGGPDGDVAGNQILNLYRFFPDTAKLLALTDVSGTIFDPKGLDLKVLVDLFHEVKPIRFYPPEALHEGGFLLDLSTKKEQTPYAQQSLVWRKKEGKMVQQWLSGNEMNHLFRFNVHQTKTDIFIPGGGRPRTLNETNYREFLDEHGAPTSKAIVEGANLYLTPAARRHLEKLGVLIIKDSSANKGGVICSSFEVLSGLTLSESEFLKMKQELVEEILAVIRTVSRDEATLLLSTHQKTGEFLTDLSDRVSYKINTLKYQLLEFFSGVELSQDPKDPLIACFLNHALPLLRTKYTDRLIERIPDSHKKAIIATYIACKMIYSRGLSWSPTIVDVLPLITKSLLTP